MNPREIDELRRRVRRRPMTKPNLPKVLEPPAPPRVDTIWVAPRVTRAQLIRRAIVVTTPIVAGIAALGGAAWAGLIQ